MRSNLKETKTPSEHATYTFPIISPTLLILCFIFYFIRPVGPDFFEFESISKQVVQALSGEYWHLFAVHFRFGDIVNLLLQLAAFLFFGIYVERRTSHTLFFWLVVSSIVVVSALQVGIAGITASGLSGLITAYYVFALIRHWGSNPGYKLSLYHHLVFVAYIGLNCIFCTEGYLSLNLTAIIGGLVWGSLNALIRKAHTLVRFGFHLVSLSLIVSFIVWSPFSVAYDLVRAEKSYFNQDYPKAEHLYKEVLRQSPGHFMASAKLQKMEIRELGELARKYHLEKNYSLAMHTYQVIIQKDPNDEWAQQNYLALKVYNLSQRAYKLHILEQLEEAYKLYQEILELDPHNDWAKEAMAEIPEHIRN